MATKAAVSSISGLARAMVQHGLLSEYDAETFQGQAQTASIGFVEQLLLAKRMNAAQVAVFASRAFRAPLFDLAGYDLDQINKDFVDARIAVTRRVLPLHKRGNRLFVAVSDPANMQALDEVRFKTNLVIDPVVVEDDKLGIAIVKVIETLGQTLKDLVTADDLEVDLLAETGQSQPDEEGNNPDVDDAPVVSIEVSAAEGSVRVRVPSPMLPAQLAELVAFLAHVAQLGAGGRELVPEPLDLTLQLAHPGIRPAGGRLNFSHLEA